jgi:hypothetical protein
VHRGPAAGAVSSDRRLEHREVGHPEELPAGVVQQAEPAADLEPGGAEQCQRLGARSGGEEGAVADLRPDRLPQALALGLGQVLGDRPAERAVLQEGDVGQPAVAALLGELLPGVEDLARLGGAAGMTTAPTWADWNTRNGVSAK